MARGTISAGYSHDMPSQPMAKKVLKMNRKAAATMPVVEPGYAFMIERTTMDRDMPAAPKSMRPRRPNLSMV